jgi:hypothetical protein
VTLVGTLGTGIVGETVAVAVADGTGVEVAVAAVASEGEAVGVIVAVAVAGEPGASPAVAVAEGVAVWLAGAACATPDSPARRPTLFGSASASKPASRTNARRDIRRAHVRVGLGVWRVTVRAS